MGHSGGEVLCWIVGTDRKLLESVINPIPVISVAEQGSLRNLHPLPTCHYDPSCSAQGYLAIMSQAKIKGQPGRLASDNIAREYLN